VTDVAVRLIADAVADSDDALRKEVLAAAEAEGISGWPLQALDSLLFDPVVISEADGRHPALFVNGQHRTRAVRDADLPAVLVGITEEVDPSLRDDTHSARTDRVMSSDRQAGSSVGEVGQWT
jgi:hypothetical protein